MIVEIDKIQVRTIPGFPDYAISQDGKVWSKVRLSFQGQRLKGRWLKPGNRCNYLCVVLREKNKSYSIDIHRLVLETYVGLCPAGMECRHLNGNRQDNRLDNLCWGSRQENVDDRTRMGNTPCGEQQWLSKLTERNVRMIIYMSRTGLFTQKEIAKVYGIVPSMVSRIVNRKMWKHLWEDVD